MSELNRPSISDSYGLYPCKATYTPYGCKFSLDISSLDKNSKYGIAIYDNSTGIMIRRREFKEYERLGNIYTALIPDFDDYYMTELRAENYSDTLHFGNFDETKARKALLCPEFNWEGDKSPKIPYEDSFFYMLHVRGFTMHASSGVKHKGTFKGVSEKISYLKKLGVTAVILQPAYELTKTIKRPEDTITGVTVTDIIIRLSLHIPRAIIPAQSFVKWSKLSIKTIWKLLCRCTFRRIFRGVKFLMSLSFGLQSTI